MKNLIVFIAITILSTPLFAQQNAKIQAKDITLNDIQNILNAQKIEMYSFDLSELAKTPHSLYIYVDSYKDSTVSEVFSIPVKCNISYVNDYPENQRKKVRSKYNLGADEQIVSRIDGLGVYLMPKNDSTIHISFDMANYGTGNIILDLQSVTTPNYTTFFYDARPFKLNEIKEGEKTPLILYASGWYDKDSQIVRMCGESRIDPDLSKNNVLKDSPHYYVIGIRAEKIDK